MYLSSTDNRILEYKHTKLSDKARVHTDCVN